ncbi:hypothetical protein AKJ09_10643 [Labilithrix luteola]|uniref:Uncharacterized protein n=1 Tax=Labilithrix luteola TaxID=1391654 RepID=A0A0K1QEW9_9BACT|nr:hypothetical protein [Labilithrix luteola]AKV03980.1 hypothetical protein AKJ09_10643 [Labilithrix luteola]
MKEQGLPPRLSEASSDSRLAKALRIAKDYEPPKARLQDALSKFEASRGSDPTSGATQTASGGWRLFSAKTGLVVAVALAVGAARVMHASNTPASAPPVEARTPAPAASASLEVSEPSSPPQPTMSVDDLPAAPAADAKSGAASTKTARTGTAGAANPESAASFDDELELVERARTALASGDTSACLDVLDRYARVIRGGVFEREVAVMRIEALMARGERARAKALGEKFLATTPNSPYTDRVRSFVTKASTSP